MGNLIGIIIVVLLVMAGLSGMMYHGDVLYYNQTGGNNSHWTVGLGFSTKIFYEYETHCSAIEELKHIYVTCKTKTGIVFKGETDRFEYFEDKIENPGKYNIFYMFTRY